MSDGSKLIDIFFRHVTTCINVLNFWIVSDFYIVIRIDLNFQLWLLLSNPRFEKQSFCTQASSRETREMLGLKFTHFYTVWRH